MNVEIGTVPTQFFFWDNLFSNVCIGSLLCNIITCHGFAHTNLLGQMFQKNLQLTFFALFDILP